MSRPAVPVDARPAIRRVYTRTGGLVHLERPLPLVARVGPPLTLCGRLVFGRDRPAWDLECRGTACQLCWAIAGEQAPT